MDLYGDVMAYKLIAIDIDTLLESKYADSPKCQHGHP